MPTITVRLLSGRTEEQKARFTALVRDAAVEVLGARAGAVRVEYQEDAPAPPAREL